MSKATIGGLMVIIGLYSLGLIAVMSDAGDAVWFRFVSWTVVYALMLTIFWGIKLVLES